MSSWSDGVKCALDEIDELHDALKTHKTITITTESVWTIVKAGSKEGKGLSIGSALKALNAPT